MLKPKILQKDYTLSCLYYQIKLPLDIEKKYSKISCECLQVCVFMYDMLADQDQKVRSIGLIVIYNKAGCDLLYGISVVYAVGNRIFFL